MPSFRTASLAALLLYSAPLFASEFEICLYGGWQGAQDSRVTITGDPVISDRTFSASWKGRSWLAPHYFGLRPTYWMDSGWGVGVEQCHAKVYADTDTLERSGLSRLEFTDGLNMTTVNGYRRWPGAIAQPYVGLGLGIAWPHVEVTGGSSKTFGYQITGPASVWATGLSRPLGSWVTTFVQYHGSYTIHHAELDTGGTLETTIITHAFDIGLGVRF